MASSEIEVVSSDSKTPRILDKPPIVDVYSACSYGDFEKLRKFVEEDGAPVSLPDVNGYYALQWASLSDFPDIVQYVIKVLLVFFILLACVCELNVDNKILGLFWKFELIHFLVQ